MALDERPDAKSVDGFARVHNAVVERIGEIRLAGFAVYCVLARHCNGKAECWPSVSTIAQLIGRKDRCVQAAIKLLVKSGFVEVIPRKTSRGDNDTNMYRLPMLLPTAGGASGCIPVAQRDAPRGRSRAHGGGAPGCTQTRLIEQDPVNKKRAPADAGSCDPRLIDLIDEWNALGERIVKNGNGARRDPPAKAVVDGWRRSQRDGEHGTAFADLGELMASIRRAKFCHGKPWFTLAWLFGKNKLGEFNAAKLLNGGYDDDHEKNRRGRSYQNRVGPGQCFDPNDTSERTL